MQEYQIVVFSLNDELCGAETSQVHEIVKFQNMSRIPEMPDYVDGIVNLRGKVVPIVNLNKKFSMGDTEITKKTKVIITEIKKNPIGFIVNDVSEIIKLNEDEVDATPEILRKTGTSYLKGVAKKGDKLISILDLEAILAFDEVETIKDNIT